MAWHAHKLQFKSNPCKINKHTSQKRVYPLLSPPFPLAHLTQDPTHLNSTRYVPHILNNLPNPGCTSTKNSSYGNRSPSTDRFPSGSLLFVFFEDGGGRGMTR